MHQSTMLALKAAIAGGQATMMVYNRGEVKVMLKNDQSPLTEADIESNLVIERLLQTSNLPVLSEEGKLLSYEERKGWHTLWIVDPIDGTKEFVKRSGEFTVNIALVEDGKPILGVIVAPALNTVYWGDESGAYKSMLHKNWLKKTAMDVVTDLSPIKLPCKTTDQFTVVRSVSHYSDETKEYMQMLDEEIPNSASLSIGSSLKMCVLAEGGAHLYPRLGPTMEWDTAAGQAILEASGGQLFDWTTKESLRYNREELLNPWFIATAVNHKPLDYWFSKEEEESED
ncbi:3'(2'),5'-bisphosphate nucleotidase CysQ [Carboxylicivirga sp. N1Y90]|uniref:3'(2'),5'-bisphosphate nucleotidase CysQ n=1 Tax=Carboxylicivirga fragile TaxID=3417571 RepID=UPI003D33C777|nr:3'(2'),5'-bisphosphate nucleotidase CysQ [Marinilabiliaceae bacterium N1Y90]